jgi:hypothetical protein
VQVEDLGIARQAAVDPGQALRLLGLLLGWGEADHVGLEAAGRLDLTRGQLLLHLAFRAACSWRTTAATLGSARRSRAKDAKCEADSERSTAR